MGLWKTHFVIGTKASGLSLTKPNWFTQHDQPTTLHTLEHLLAEILLITIAAVLSGANWWNEIEACLPNEWLLKLSRSP
ncbi:MAG: hypothetical protein WCE63_12085 [Acidobacteriaceae bacterium]